MRISEPTEWVVYRTANRLQSEGQCAICSQDEWNAMHASAPDNQVLIQEHIGSESAAERLARSLIVPEVKTKPSKRAPATARVAASLSSIVPPVGPESKPG